MLYSVRVKILCDEGHEVFALSDVLRDSSEYFSGLFSESNVGLHIRAARPAPRENETYGSVAVEVLMELLHGAYLGNAEDEPWEPEVLDELSLDDLVDVCEHVHSGSDR